jgi:outer membrane immunogenic protein
MKIIGSSLVVACAIVSTSASAQVAAGSFSGPRVELRGGYDFLNLEGSVTDGTNSITRDEGESGASYGGEIGYDYRSNNLVFGAYAGIEGSTTKECGELYGLDELCLKSGRNITAGVRVGAVVSDNFMIYAKGGYSNGRAKVTYQDYELILADVDEGRNLSGFHLGAGAEAEIGGHVYGRLEYVYSDYGKDSVQLDDGAFSLKPTRHQVLYGMGVRF